MSLVIVGSGLAGYLLLKELRDQGYKLPIIVITADNGEFYSKPQISNALAQKKSADDLVNIAPDQMQEKYNFKLIANTNIKKLSLENKEIITDDDQIFKYDKCVLATGARPKAAVWDEYSHKINNLNDYRSFRKNLNLDSKVAIIGSGLVGCELAADLLESGYKVDLYSKESEPLSRVMPNECGGFLRQKLEQSGLGWHFVDDLTVARKGSKIIINDNAEYDQLISALGIEPNIQLALEAGLKINNGIEVDGFCQTADPFVYALGDCANVAGENLAYVAPIRQCVNVLSKRLMGLETRMVVYPIMPVIVKTPMCRIIFVNSKLAENWELLPEADGLLAKQYDADGLLRGFVLMGTAAAQRAAMMKECIK